MGDIKKASFNFEGYKITSINMNAEFSRSEEDVRVSFHPTGVFHSTEKKFTINLKFSAWFDSCGENNPYLDLSISGFFQFVNIESSDDIPLYFWNNGIAIFFPYLRSFISSLTVQSNTDLLVLPTWNLSSLSNPLQSNTEYK